MARKTASPCPTRVDLLSRQDVAARFGVAPQTITRWANEGILPCVRTLGGQRRYPAAEVERLVSAVWGQGPPLEGHDSGLARAEGRATRKAE